MGTVGKGAADTNVTVDPGGGAEAAAKTAAGTAGVAVEATVVAATAAVQPPVLVWLVA